MPSFWNSASTAHQAPFHLCLLSGPILPLSGVASYASKGRVVWAFKAPTKSKVTAAGTRKTFRERGSDEPSQGLLQGDPNTRAAWKDKGVTIQRRQKRKFVEEQRE